MHDNLRVISVYMDIKLKKKELLVYDISQIYLFLTRVIGEKENIDPYCEILYCYLCLFKFLFFKRFFSKKIK
jgi:hypothetical protein